MRKAAPIDTMPEFEPLTTRASNLMIEANSHRAKNEPFDAAVAWVKAGRTLAELGSKLLHADYVYEAAQDLLNAAACFLEAGDYRPAQEQLDRFSELPELTELLGSDEHIAAEYSRICAWSDESRRVLERAWEEALVQGLTLKWLNETLARLPGVAEFHRLAAKRHAQLAESRERDASAAQAAKHTEWCTKLSSGESDEFRKTPERRGTRVLLIDDEVNRPNRSAAAYLEALNEAGMRVYVALSAGEAIRYVETNKDPEDVVILDVMMADAITIDGDSYTADDAGLGILRHRLRNPASSYYNVPILILTNRDPDILARRTEEFARVRIAAKHYIRPSLLPDVVQKMIPQQA